MATLGCLGRRYVFASLNERQSKLAHNAEICRTQSASIATECAPIMEAWITRLTREKVQARLRARAVRGRGRTRQRETEMALEAMHSVMMLRLREGGATREQIEAYERLWATSVTSNRTDNPIPCPDCHIAGALGRLESIDEEDGGDTVMRCVHCAVRINFPTPRNR